MLILISGAKNLVPVLMISNSLNSLWRSDRLIATIRSESLRRTFLVYTSCLKVSTMAGMACMIILMTVLIINALSLTRWCKVWRVIHLIAPHPGKFFETCPN